MSRRDGHARRPGALRRLKYAAVRRAGRRYVAGMTRESALAACERIAARGDEVVLAHWNDDGTPPEAVASRYADDLRALREHGISGYVSVKSPPLGNRPELIAAVNEAAALIGVAAHWDSMAPGDQDAVLAAALAACAAGGPTGATLPSRWARSSRDAAVLRDHPIPIRIVKGEWESDEPSDPFEGMLDCARRLAGRKAAVRVATHDAELAGAALDLLLEAGTPAELEQLIGLPASGPRDQAAERGVPVRVLVPYGAARPPYPLSEAWHRATALRLVRDLAR